jgi:dTDP-4-amino-4,6-dideoxygalactose transaminase
MIALRLAGVKPGDDVVSTAMTCSATNMAIKAVGANIIWADILLDGNINPESVKRNITPKTKAVVALHWGGWPCNLDALLNACEERGIQLVEDAAHALGAEYRGFKIGNYGHFAAFSLQAIKHINTIEGGFLCCDRRDSYAKGKVLRWFGIDRDGPRTDLRCEQDIAVAGSKGNLVDPLAVIGIEQMKGLPEVVAQHRANAAYYRQEMHGLKKIRPLPYEDDRKSAYWLFSVLVDDKRKFRAFMAERGVMVSAIHSRNDVFSCFADSKRGPLPGLDYFAEHQMAIPVHWALTEGERTQIVNAMKEYEVLA